MSGVRGPWRTFRWPLMLALVSLAGLVLGLVAQGVTDVLGFVGVTLPVLVIGWFLWRPRRARRPS